MKIDFVEEMIRRVQHSVVLLRTQQGVGTGFVVSSEGHILTCNHVVHTEHIEVISWATQKKKARSLRGIKIMI